MLDFYYVNFLRLKIICQTLAQYGQYPDGISVEFPIRLAATYL